MTDGLKDKYRKTIIRILSANKRVERVVLFGSRAMETFTPTSDVDIALFGDNLTLTDQAQLAADVEELTMPQSVDLLLHKSITSRKLLKHIEKHGVEWVKMAGGKRRWAMGSDWKPIKLGKYIEINDSTYSPREHWPFINYLDTGNITENKVSEVKHLVPGKDKIPSRARRKIKSGDIIYSTVRPNQKHFGLIKNVPDNFLVSTGFAVISGKASLAHTPFIYWFLAQDHIVNHLHTIGEQSTSAYPSIKPSDIEQLRLEIPSFDHQRAIAHILGSLDDKIELNRQMNRTLEKMAQAIFKSWFIDFDPVHAKADGRDTGLPKNIAELFPDSFEDSELGKIPKEWEVKPIGDVIELAYGKSLPKNKRVYGQFPVYGSGGITGFHNEHIVQGPGIIMGRKGTVGSVYWEEKNFFPIDTVFYVNTKMLLPLYWVFLRLSLMDIQKLGADSAVPGVNRNSVYAQKWAVPAENIVEKFQAIFDGFLRQAEENRRQVVNLSKTRDILLPKLISGELPIPDVETLLNGLNIYGGQHG